MKLILGLGNPTKTYNNTRHNIGKTFVGILVEKFKLVPHK
jgi:peptidyl-tRNA hydrolase